MQIPSKSRKDFFTRQPIPYIPYVYSLTGMAVKFEMTGLFPVFPG